MEFPLTRDCFVTSITLVALNKLGQGLFDMDPLLVRDAVEDVFGLKNMPQRMFDKLRQAELRPYAARNVLIH